MTIWLLVACWISKATRAQAHARTRATTHARAHAHTEICNTYSFSTAKKWFRERATMLRCAYIAFLVY
jgi:hypothetical protein